MCKLSEHHACGCRERKYTQRASGTANQYAGAHLVPRQVLRVHERHQRKGLRHGLQAVEVLVGLRKRTSGIEL